MDFMIMTMVYLVYKTSTKFTLDNKGEIKKKHDASVPFRALRTSDVNRRSSYRL